MTALLPDRFAALEPFVERWSAETIAARASLRDASTGDERRAFHAAASPLAAEALTMLGDRPLAALDTRERALLTLMLSFAHVALAEDIQGAGEAEHVIARRHMPVTA